MFQCPNLGLPLIITQWLNCSDKGRLFPLAALVTPNLPEAERLAGTRIGDEAQIVSAAERIRGLGAKAVLIKGGHATGESVRDVLVTETGAEVFEAPRIATNSTHGTGCTLSTAIACGLANQLSLRAAVSSARDFVQAAIASAPGFGRGHGPLNHMHPRS